MSAALTPGRRSLAGTAVLMACACGAGAATAKLGMQSGLPITSKVTHSLFLLVGMVLVFSAFLQISRRAAAISLFAFLTLGVAAALTPPMMMSASRVPWHAPQVAGAVLYLIFGAALAYAFWIAFPNPRPGATAVALTGTAVASGCSCCMVTGAVSGLAATAGGSIELFMRNPVIFFSGIAMAAVGLGMMRGLKPIPWLLAGAIITRWGGNALRYLGDWMVGDVNLRFIPGYMIYLIGAGLVMTAWAVAYEPSRTRMNEEPVGMPADAALQRT